MATGPQALITPRLVGQAMPDQVRLSVFGPWPKAVGNVRAQTDQAHRYFKAYPGAKFDDREGDWVGPGYVLRVGDLTCKFGVAKTFSMSATFNPQRLTARRCGLTQWRHPEGGNTVVSLLAQGYDRLGLRRGMCADIADLSAQAKLAYETIVPKALGEPIIGEVQANFSRLELIFDFEHDPDAIASYERAFGKVVRVYDQAQGLAGRLRKGESFRIYAKPPVHAGPVVRFEIAITGARIKKITESQRVPADAAGVECVLRAVEDRYMPIWLQVERHRLPHGGPGLPRLIYRAPRFRGRDEEHFFRMARQLDRRGWIKATKRNRTKLVTLKKKGLVESLRLLTRVKGIYVTTPESEPLWRALGAAR